MAHPRLNFDLFNNAPCTGYQTQCWCTGRIPSAEAEENYYRQLAEMSETSVLL